MATSNKTNLSSALVSTSRRNLLKGTAALTASVATLGFPAIVRAETPTIRIGYWPLASGQPFYVAVEKGYFKEAGINVEVQRYAGAQQVMEAMLAGRCDGSANGVGSGNLAVGELASPGTFKIICSNYSNSQFVLDEILVPANSTVKSLKELDGKKVGTGPGIQNITICKAILESAGVKNAHVIELPIAQHVASLAAGQIDACYTLEPTGTVGRLNGQTKVLETGVVSKYILGDAKAPWYGGTAALTSTVIKKEPKLVKAYIEAYAKGVEFIRKHPDESRQYFKGYTAIEGKLTSEVPLSAFTMYNEFTDSDLNYFQKFFNLYSDRKVFPKPLDVKSMIYKA